MSFLVFNEIFYCWEGGKTPLDYHLIFEYWSEPDLRSFIRMDRNHPSVIMWGYDNEVKEQTSDGAGAAEMSLRLRGACQQEDPTRQSSASLHYSFANTSMAKTQEMIGLISRGEGMRWVQHTIIRLNKRPLQYASFHETFPDRLIVGSEVATSLSLRAAFTFPVASFNSAPINETSGADPDVFGVSAYKLYSAETGLSPDRVFLTQDEHPFVSGGFVWTGWDYIGEPYYFDEIRSASLGTFDLAGLKKERSWLYQARWRPDYPVAHIVPHWNWLDRVGEVTPVYFFTSGDEAGLFVNEKSQGRRTRQDQGGSYRLKWDDVTYEPGEGSVAVYKDGKEWAADKVETTGQPSSLRVQPDRGVIAANGEDSASLAVEIIDDKGNVVPLADNTISVSVVSGSGEVVATDNGRPADFTAFTS